MKKSTFPFLFWLLSFTIGCQQKAIESSKGIEVDHWEIKTATLSGMGIKGDTLREVVDSIKTGFYPNRHSLLVYKDGRLVVEEYFPGQDQSWGNDLGLVQHGKDVLHDMRSVSKSVVSACIGLAVEQGKIKSVDQPIFDFFKDYERYKNEGREKLTIKHFLTMTSGLEWNEEVPYDNPENSEIQMINSGDGIGFVLSRKLIAEPGTEWTYNGGTTEILAIIIQRVSGKNIHEFAKEYLFEPLGIKNSEWAISPATNTPSAASGLRLRSRDMLKFGILCQQNGRWGNQQILSKEWVKRSLTSSIERPDGGGYGYQFWILNFTVNGEEISIPTAIGNGDQRIFLDREKDLIMVTTAGNYNKWNIANNANAIFRRIYPSFSKD